jgi:hypothetical protein
MQLDMGTYPATAVFLAIALLLTALHTRQHTLELFSQSRSYDESLKPIWQSIGPCRHILGHSVLSDLLKILTQNDPWSFASQIL